MRTAAASSTNRRPPTTAWSTCQMKKWNLIQSPSSWRQKHCQECTVAGGTKTPPASSSSSWRFLFHLVLAQTCLYGGQHKPPEVPHLSFCLILYLLLCSAQQLFTARMLHRKGNRIEEWVEEGGKNWNYLTFCIPLDVLRPQTGMHLVSPTGLLLIFCISQLCSNLRARASILFQAKSVCTYNLYFMAIL